MHKLVTIILFFISFAANSAELKQTEIQENTLALGVENNTLNFQYVDSVSYQYYLAGNWNELIKTGNEAIHNQIDFKRLRQRIGYAYFMKSDYYSAMAQYEEALSFDNTDLDTRVYIYYCGINTGNESYSRYHAEKLPVYIQKNLDLKPVKIVDAIDLEYNYKTNDSQLRSNPEYWRIGCTTKLGYQLSLYQAFSTYSQIIDSTYTNNISLDSYLYRSRIKQNEYYAHLNWKPLEHVDFLQAYHYISTRTTDSLYYKIKLLPENKELFNYGVTTGNMFLAKIAFKYNRFDVGISASVLNYNSKITQQYTLQGGITFPGKAGIKIKSTLDAMFDDESQRLIFSQNAGFVPIKNVWVEGNVSFGNLANYVDFNGLYILNSKDPTIFRSGATVFWQVLNKISIFGNYGYDTKLLRVTSNTNINYNQHSFSGGIIWKI